MMGVVLDYMGAGLKAVHYGGLCPEPCWKYRPLCRRDGRWFVCMEFA